MGYQFFGFDAPQSFQRFSCAAAAAVLGPGVTPFGVGRDNGRDAIFDGEVPYPFPPAECWNGYGVIQVKYKEKPEGTAKDQKWALDNLETELEEFVSSPNRAPKPQYYVYVTNVDLAAAGKGWDEAERLLKSYYGKLPLRGHAVWAASQLRMFMDKHPDVRRAFHEITGLPLPKPDRCFVGPPIPPRIDAEFLGRDSDLAELRRRLGILPKPPADRGDLAAESDRRRTSGGRRRVVMKGIPGVGKSTLACRLAFDAEDDPGAFPDGVLWVSLGPNPDIGRHGQIKDWVEEVGKCVREPFEPRTRENSEDYWKDATKFLRKHLLHLRVLIVIDDAWRTDDARKFDLGGDGCATLITTRLDNVARDLAADVRNDLYKLEVLDPASSTQLFGALAPDVDREESKALVAELNGLPLALQVAGRLLQAKHIVLDVRDFIEDLRARRNQPLVYEKLPDNMRDLVKASHPADLKTVAALLELSVQQLSECARVGFGYLGALAPRPAFFRKAFVAGIWSGIEETDKGEHAGPSLDVDRVLEELCHVGLIEYAMEPVRDEHRPEAIGMRYGLHSLLVAFALSRASGQDGLPTQDRVLFLHCQHCLRIVGDLEVSIEKGEFAAALDGLAQGWPNIVLAQRESASRGGSDERWAHCCNEFGRTMATPIRFWLHDQVGTTWARDAVAAARSLNDPDELAWRLATLAANETEEEESGSESTGAIEHSLEAASLFQASGNEHGESYARAHLGHKLLAAERYDEARECLLRVLELVEHVGDPRCSVHVKCTSLVGLARLKRINGDGDGAREYLNQALSAAREQSCWGCEAAALAEFGSLIFRKYSNIDDALDDTALTEQRKADLEADLRHVEQAAELFRRAKNHGRKPACTP